ncbi:MAG: phage portal protein [Planctomycetes bacterium]|nr:phage portal protein [Planctomycetota bacterium]
MSTIPHNRAPLVRILDANGRPFPSTRALSSRSGNGFAGAKSRSVALRHDAARMDRVRTRARSGSADGDLAPDLQVLREKSRALVRDDAHGAAAVRVLVENVVGDGIRPQAAVHPENTGLTQKQCDEWNRAAERIWCEWAAAHADANDIGSFDDLTRQVYRSRVVDGEALVHRIEVDGDDRRLRTAWEMIDVDRLQDPTRLQALAVRMGVEIGTRGQPVAYWITPHHPDDLRFLNGQIVGANWPERIERVRLGIWNVLHVFRRDRAGQSRGLPALTAAMPLFEHLHHYLDSEIIAARANSNVAMFVRRPIDDRDPDLAPVDDIGPNGDGEIVYHETLEPGTIEYLNEGEEIQPFTPNRPGSTFDPFVTRILRAICAAMGLPYELVVKDFGQMTYSSSRAVLLEARRGFTSEQNSLIGSWLQPAWETVMREAIVRGLLPVYPAMVQNLRAFLAARWIRPAWGWVDPVKEIESARLAVEANLSTPDIEASRAGLDATDILEQRARFYVRAREIEARNGLEPGTLTRERSERIEAVQPKAGKGEEQKPPAGKKTDDEDDDQ